MQNKFSKRFESFAGLSGIFGPVIMGLGMLFSALAYQGRDGQYYNLANHFVSELGELGVSPYAVVYNWSLILGGVFTTIFMVYLALQVDHWLKYPLGLLSVYATINGSLVGIYPMNYLEAHIRVAMRFFNLGLLVTFLYSMVFLFNKKHPFPRWMAILGFMNAATFAWFIYFPTESATDPGFKEGMSGFLTNRPDFIPLALLEWVVILGILVWVLALAFYLIRSKLSR